MINQDVMGDAATMLPSAKPSVSAQKPKQRRQMHRLSNVVRGRYKGDLAQIDGRSALSRTIQEWKAELVDSLGGSGNLSAQQTIVVETIVRDRLAIESIENWLATQPSLVNKRKRSLYPIVLQLSQLKDGMSRRLALIGLERKARPPKTLAEVLSGSNRQGDQPGA